MNNVTNVQMLCLNCQNIKTFMAIHANGIWQGKCNTCSTYCYENDNIITFIDYLIKIEVKPQDGAIHFLLNIPELINPIDITSVLTPEATNKLLNTFFNTQNTKRLGQ